ncbi:hypothetical protein [Streptomyces sp. NPDC050704]|uniref:hypothetical protein n=1 Tax=Streptomyces sp. NPDC050704 TaxID=3157219 RepID=UPI00342F2AEA
MKPAEQPAEESAQEPVQESVPESAEESAQELTDFVTDPAARVELARRMAELADLVEEAGEALGEILEGVQRGFDSAERNRGVNHSST